MWDRITVLVELRPDLSLPAPLSAAAEADDLGTRVNDRSAQPLPNALHAQPGHAQEGEGDQALGAPAEEPGALLEEGEHEISNKTIWASMASCIDQYFGYGARAAEGPSAASQLSLVLSGRGGPSVVHHWNSPVADLKDLLSTVELARADGGTFFSVIGFTIKHIRVEVEQKLVAVPALSGARLKVVTILFDPVGENGSNPFRYTEPNGAVWDIREALTVALKEPGVPFRRLHLEIIRVVADEAAPRRGDVFSLEMLPRVSVSVYHVPIGKLPLVARNLAQKHFELSSISVNFERFPEPVSFLYAPTDEHGLFVNDRTNSLPIWTPDLITTRRIDAEIPLSKLEIPKSLEVKCSHTLIPVISTLEQPISFPQGSTVMQRTHDDGDNQATRDALLCITAEHGLFRLDCLGLTKDQAFIKDESTEKEEPATLFGSQEAMELLTPFVAFLDNRRIDASRVKQETLPLRVLAVYARENRSDLFPDIPSADRPASYKRLINRIISRAKARSIQSSAHAEVFRLTQDTLLGGGAGAYFGLDVPKALRPGASPAIHPPSATAAARRDRAASSPQQQQRPPPPPNLPERKLTSYLHVPQPRLDAANDEEAWLGVEGGLLDAAGRPARNSLWSEFVGRERAAGKRRRLDRADFDGRVEGLNLNAAASAGSGRGGKGGLIPMAFD